MAFYLNYLLFSLSVSFTSGSFYYNLFGDDFVAPRPRPQHINFFEKIPHNYLKYNPFEDNDIGVFNDWESVLHLDSLMNEPYEILTPYKRITYRSMNDAFWTDHDKVFDLINKNSNNGRMFFKLMNPIEKQTIYETNYQRNYLKLKMLKAKLNKLKKEEEVIRNLINNYRKELNMKETEFKNSRSNNKINLDTMLQSTIEDTKNYIKKNGIIIDLSGAKPDYQYMNNVVKPSFMTSLSDVNDVNQNNMDLYSKDKAVSFKELFKVDNEKEINGIKTDENIKHSMAKNKQNVGYYFNDLVNNIFGFRDKNKSNKHKHSFRKTVANHKPFAISKSIENENAPQNKITNDIFENTFHSNKPHGLEAFLENKIEGHGLFDAENDRRQISDYPVNSNHLFSFKTNQNGNSFEKSSVKKNYNPELQETTEPKQRIIEDGFSQPETYRKPMSNLFSFLKNIF